MGDEDVLTTSPPEPSEISSRGASAVAISGFIYDWQTIRDELDPDLLASAETRNGDTDPGSILRSYLETFDGGGIGELARVIDLADCLGEEDK